MDTTREFAGLNNLSLCSGGAGLDLGLELALGSVSTVCWVEWEAFAIEYLETRMEAGCLHPAPLWTNLRTFDGRPWRGVVDSLTAGYPCQPFSLAGKRGGSDDPRHLWPHVARIIGETQPGIVFLENVGGHLSLGAEEVFSELQGLGYRIAAGLFTAEEVGATHKRERLFIVGMADATSSGQRERFGLEEATIDRSESRSQDALQVVADSTDAGRWRQAAGPGSWWGAFVAGAGRDVPELPVFPPGPDAFDDWATILKTSPWLRPATEPGVCSVVDGLALDRTRWLRLLGNGVVPLQAAYAFVSLWACLTNEGTEP